MNDEKVFFQRGDITVTNARFLVGPQTFAMRNITSVRADEIEPDSKHPGYLMFFGIVIALVGFVGAGIPVGVIGIAMLAGGLVGLEREIHGMASEQQRFARGWVRVELEEDRERELIGGLFLRSRGIRTEIGRFLSPAERKTCEFCRLQDCCRPEEAGVRFDRETEAESENA